MKKFLAHSALALTLASPQAQAQNSQYAEVKNFIHTPESATGMLASKVNWQVHGLCNFSRVEIEALVYNVTAKHCLIGYANGNFAYDIIWLQSITDFYKKLGLSQIQYESLIWIPKAVKPSSYNIITLGKKPLTIVGCFPDVEKSRMVCYSITGVPYINRMWMAVLQISLKDQQRILAYDSSRMRTRIQGMSWAPVLDPEGNVFWVLAMNTNTWDTIQSLTQASQIMIEPIRDLEWKLLISTRRIN
jgi:hypothetical protein